MERRLIVLSNGANVGVVAAGRDAVTLTYDSAWLTADAAFPVSLSLPLNRQIYGHALVDSYLWNLLPDNERVLGKWAERFGVSARNAFGLIREVGEDVAGALQFVRPERVDAVLAKSGGTIDWISVREVGERLADLHRDESAWSRSSDVGFFSLSGAQPKLALLHNDGKWGIPNGRVPTTHILKPPSNQFDGHAENEHFCMTLAGLLGLAVARSNVQTFDGQVAIVVERFDRVAQDSGFVRVPMEDACQALGVHPRKKYQNHGGPGVRQITSLLRLHSSEPDVDVRTFVDALAFNWLVGGTDAHAKNYSVLIAAGGRVRLAPLYDIASALGYQKLDPKKMKHAMKIGSHYELKDITSRDWQKVGTETGLGGDEVVERVKAVANRLPDAVVTAQRLLKQGGLVHPQIPYLCGRIADHVKSCKLRLFSARP